MAEQALAGLAGSAKQRQSSMEELAVGLGPAAIMQPASQPVPYSNGT